MDAPEKLYVNILYGEYVAGDDRVDPDDIKYIRADLFEKLYDEHEIIKQGMIKSYEDNLVLDEECDGLKQENAELKEELAKLQLDNHNLVAGTCRPERLLAKYQPCGCVICTCEDDHRCYGCGAKNCGTHPIDDIPNPVYVDEQLQQRDSTQDPDVFWVLFDADTGYIRKLHKTAPLAFFESEEDAKRAAENTPGTDYKEVRYYAAPQPPEAVPVVWRTKNTTTGMWRYHHNEPKGVPCEALCLAPQEQRKVTNNGY